MKKIYSILINRFNLLLFLLLAVSSGMQAQTPQHFSVGTGSNNSFPFNSTSSNKVQWIYVPAEFAAAPSGLITHIYFKSSTTATAAKTYTNLTVKMGYTAQVNTTATYITGLTTVFFASTYVIPSVTANGWVKLTLTTPFFYSNTQNLVVEASQTAYTPSGFSIVQNSAGGNKRTYGNVANATGTAGSGLANFGFDLLAFQNNAGVESIVEPGQDICVGSHPVKATIKNLGANTINNVMVNWSVNNVVQPAVLYNTPLPVGASASVSLGNFPFVSPVLNYNIKVWTSNPNGVADGNPADDETDAMRDPMDPPNAAVYFSTNYGCPGDSIKLHAPLDPLYTYIWQKNADPIAGNDTNFLYIKESGFYSLKIINPACSAQSVFHKMTIAPLEVDLGNDTITCELPNGIVLDPGITGAAYNWSTGSTFQTIKVTSESGKYWVNVSLGPNCQASDTVDLDISPLPRINGITYLKNNNTYHFAPGGPLYVDNYLWEFGDGTSDTAASPSHTYPEGFDANVKLHVFNSCGKTTTQLQLPLSVGNIAADGGIAIYPNPASSTLHVAVKKDGVSINGAKIINTLGVVVYNETLNDLQETSVDISSLPNGNYSIILNTQSGVITRNFTVMK
jgi:hypothetical protein